MLQSRKLAPQYFGEGIVNWKGKLIQLTWQNQIGFIYDLATFKPVGQFSYPGEGWALTQNGQELVMSDGTPAIRFLNPDTLKETHRITVTADGAPVGNINELEWVKGEILANIWQTDQIARIDPKTGHVLGWIDLTGLLPAADASGDPDDVLNGIAYDAKGDRLFVTGKRWPKLFEIRLVKKPGWLSSTYPARRGRPAAARGLRGRTHARAVLPAQRSLFRAPDGERRRAGLLHPAAPLQPDGIRPWRHAVGLHGRPVGHGCRARPPGVWRCVTMHLSID